VPRPIPTADYKEKGTEHSVPFINNPIKPKSL
jgi:hypothetical protein